MLRPIPLRLHLLYLLLPLQPLLHHLDLRRILQKIHFLSVPSFIISSPLRCPVLTLFPQFAQNEQVNIFNP
ncbi:hypothetical protein HMPREF1619_00384 [Klebsiella pneumoniae 909957]|nr:hypothetical protein HMPREF1619_00384 [Klebsiella pneumoniae 909957]